MSKYPTPWESLAWDEVRAADGDTVIEYDERWIIKIDLDELVARVNAGAEAEAWKKSATTVLNNLSLQEVGEALNVPLGCCISSAILPGILELKARLAFMTKVADQAIAWGCQSCPALDEKANPELAAYTRESP